MSNRKFWWFDDFAAFMHVLLTFVGGFYRYQTSSMGQVCELIYVERIIYTLIYTYTIYMRWNNEGAKEGEVLLAYQLSNDFTQKVLYFPEVLAAEELYATNNYWRTT